VEFSGEFITPNRGMAVRDSREDPNPVSLHGVSCALIAIDLPQSGFASICAKAPGVHASSWIQRA
jgi:hypothetical protein